MFSANDGVVIINVIQVTTQINLITITIQHTHIFLIPQLNCPHTHTHTHTHTSSSRSLVTVTSN